MKIMVAIMKVRIVSMICALIVAASAFAVAFILPSGQAAFTTGTSGISSQASAAGYAGNAGYIVKLYNGRIGIFSSGSSVPDSVLDINVTLLPQSEQARLTDGIQVKTHDELLSLIENYTS